MKKRIVSCLIAVVVLAGLASASQAPLQIYSIDVEGGQSTLIVSPAGQAMLIDTGWDGFGGRDADRIVAVAHAAGVHRIDYLLITHYHRDHVGGAAQLLQRMPITTFIDHGPNLENAEQVKNLYAEYQKVVAQSKARHLVVKPGDRIPLSKVDIRVLAAAGKIIDPETNKTKPNSLCSAEPAPPEDKTENAASVGVMVSYGKFRMLDMGDLTKRKELELVCPANRVGPVDLLIVSHHGLSQSNSKAFVQAVRPKVAVMNNGAHKGGNPEAWQIVHDSPGLEDLWQLHYAADSDKAHNSDPKLIANPGETDGNYVKVVAEKDGTFVVTNSRNAFQKRYGR